MEHVDAVKKSVDELLSQLGISGQVVVEVKYDEAAQMHLVSLQTESPAILIGFHGENLSAMQLVLGQHLHSQLGEWINLSLNVNDYRERRETALHALADSAVARVLATGQAHSLPPMPANERRIVHLYLSEHPQVVTESTGEGRSRSIIISPKPVA